MSDHLDGFFAENVTDPTPAPGVNAAPEPAELPEVDVAASPDAPAVEETPDEPAPGTRHVPLSALEAERKQRQDWKEKFVRSDEQIKAMEQRAKTSDERFAALEKQLADERTRVTSIPQPEARPVQLPNPAEDPEGYTAHIQHLMFNERANLSQMTFQRDNPGVDVKVIADRFKAEAEKNPILSAQLRASPHPYAFAAEHVARQDAMAAIGDPLQYREKLKAELMAEIQGSAGQPAPAAAARAAVALPASLATARSAAPRGQPSAEGSLAFNDLFPKR